jgi:DUF438 domain-containing protein
VKDPVKALAHDHGDLNRRVLALGARIRTLQSRGSASDELLAELEELRDLLFLHFAREEEALFPFVAESVPDLRAQVDMMFVAHDTICGALARMVPLAATNASIATIAALFDRFENTYAAHAHAESELLDSLEDCLDAKQRAQLFELVAGI